MFGLKAYTHTAYRGYKGLSFKRGEFDLVANQHDLSKLMRCRDMIVSVWTLHSLVAFLEVVLWLFSFKGCLPKLFEVYK